MKQKDRLIGGKQERGTTWEKWISQKVAYTTHAIQDQNILNFVFQYAKIKGKGKRKRWISVWGYLCLEDSSKVKKIDPQ